MAAADMARVYASHTDNSSINATHYKLQIAAEHIKGSP